MGFDSDINRGTGKYMFVCYSHHDISLIEQEAEWLRRQGFKLWYDDHISAGHAWSEELAEAITGASAVLYFISRHSVSSQYCIDELHFAKDKMVPVLTIEVEEVQMSPGLQLTLATKQFVRMHGVSRNAYRSKLSAGLNALLAGKSQHRAHPSHVPTSAPFRPRVLRARLVGASAAVFALAFIFFLS